MSYKDLIVWQKAIILVKETYILTRGFPKDELYGLISQIRRAVVSIPSNIAEGHGRRSGKERLQFFSIAFGSALELETQIIISKQLFPELEYSKVESLLTEVLKMLNVLVNKKAD